MSASGQVLPENLRALLLTGGMNVLAAVLILIAGWTVASWLSRGAGRALDRTRHVDETLKPITVTLVRYGVLVVTVLAVLRRFGVETTSLIAVIGAAGLAIGLAMQGTLSNVAAGVMLLFLRPFRIGDYIEAAGQGGTVREIGLFTTILLSADLVYISVPNAQIFGGTIINYTREPTRRINFTVGIDYADDIAAAQKIVLGVLESDPRVLKTPKPLAPVGGLGASSVEIVVRCWVPNTVYWDTLFDLHKAVKLALDAGGITIPFQQHMVSFRNGSAPGSDIKN
ncbi:MAG: mechanosensitive ion channel [Pseudomonadota bacterium]|nr:mechanosensitive ion channel [Pseudomonadota bacterium]